MCQQLHRVRPGQATSNNTTSEKTITATTITRYNSTELFNVFIGLCYFSQLFHIFFCFKQHVVRTHRTTYRLAARAHFDKHAFATAPAAALKVCVSHSSILVIQLQRHFMAAFSALATACYDFEMSHTSRFLSPEFPLAQRAKAAVAPVAKRPSIKFAFTFAFDFCCYCQRCCGWLKLVHTK